MTCRYIAGDLDMVEGAEIVGIGRLVTLVVGLGERSKRT